MRGVHHQGHLKALDLLNLSHFYQFQTLILSNQAMAFKLLSLTESSLRYYTILSSSQSCFIFLFLLFLCVFNFIMISINFDFNQALKSEQCSLHVINCFCFVLFQLNQAIICFHVSERSTTVIQQIILLTKYRRGI